MSSVSQVVVLALVGALLGVFLYGFPVGGAVRPGSFMTRHPLLSALWGFTVGAVVWLAWHAVFDDQPFEAEEIVSGLASVPVILAVGNYTAGRMARRRSVDSSDRRPPSRDSS